MSSEISLAYATFPDRTVAEEICRALVEEQLVACANVFAPHLAIYRWEGEVRAEAEVAAIFKLPTTQRETLAQRFRELHPHAVPALVWIDVTGGSTDFVEWVRGPSAGG